VEKFVEELASLGRHMFWEVKFLGLDVMVQFFVVLASEREFATQKSIKKNSKSPYISWRT
jgi:hypothetical protein